MDGTLSWIDDRRLGSAFHLVPVAAALLLSIGTANGQLVTDVTAIPNTGRPPVVFVNGYQRTCSGATFAGTFGRPTTCSKLMLAYRYSSITAPNESPTNHPPIETLGNAFGRFLTASVTSAARKFSQVDIVAHSMGGLIVRSYLAGKQPRMESSLLPRLPRFARLFFSARPTSDLPPPDCLAELPAEMPRRTSFNRAAHLSSIWDLESGHR